MGNVGSLEHNRLGSKFVQIGRVNFPASIASDRVGSLLIRQKEDQVRFSLRGHGLSGPALNQPWRPAAMVELGSARAARALPIGNFWRRNICNSSVSWFA
jgi:hypothetical protein